MREGIAENAEKVQAILGALRSGIVGVLATTINSARAILQLDKERERDA